jgi:hypothetical protein
MAEKRINNYPKQPVLSKYTGMQDGSSQEERAE